MAHRQMRDGGIDRDDQVEIGHHRGGVGEGVRPRVEILAQGFGLHAGYRQAGRCRGPSAG